MAKLPDVTAYRPAPNPTRAIASVSQSAAAATGAAMQRMGETANVVGLHILDREATAQAKDADALASDKIRQLLYDPETGFANLQGSAAVNARANIEKQLDELSGTLSANLSNEAKRKLEDSLRGRIERAKQTIDTHTSGERRNWINGATEARVNSAFQDSLVDPASTATSLGIIEQEYRGMALREGWSTEELNDKLGAAKSKVHAGIVEKIALVDPQAAVGYLSENRGNMVGSDVVSLEAKLIPMAKEWEGRKLGAAAAGGLPIYQHETKIEYNMGPARPNKPDAPVLSVIGKSVQDILGAGARVVVTSGKEDDGHQHGSNRHGTGNAADIAIYRADGSQVLSTDPDMARIAKAAAGNGAVGIGFGAEYMGGSHIHIDLVEPGAGQSNTWASGGKAMRGEIVDLINARKKTSSGGINSILEIQDPTTRDAALNEYKLRSAVADGQRKAVQAAAGNAAFQAVESGGKVDDLTFEEKASIGQDGMTSLRAYERSKAAGIPVQTKPEAYMMLKQMQIQDPEMFRSINLLAYSDQLSDGDRKSFIDAQAKAYDPAAGMAASTLMSVATNQLRGIGIKANDPKEAKVQTQLLKWQESFILQNGKEPTALEVDQMVGKLLMEVVIDPPGMNLMNTKGRVFEGGGMDSVDGIIAADSLEIGDKTIPPGTAGELAELMRQRGMEVTPESLMEQLALFAEERL